MVADIELSVVLIVVLTVVALIVVEGGAIGNGFGGVNGCRFVVTGTTNGTDESCFAFDVDAADGYFQLVEKHVSY